MKFSIALLTLAVVATGSQAFRWQLPSSISRELPSFCHDDPCPGYDVKERGPQNTYEVRAYDQTTWVTTTVNRTSLTKAIVEGYVPLERYLKGNNAEERTIASGKPVGVTIEPLDASYTKAGDNFTVAFYLSENDEKTAPKPDDDNVKIYQTPAGGEVYVYSFGGFAKESSILSSAAKLAAALGQDNKEFNPDLFIFASYDSPARLADRHNEIWFMPKSSSESTAA